MKTKLVRPVLIATNNIDAKLTMYHNGYRNQDGSFDYCELSTNLDHLQYHTNQQLILISLDPDEKIEENDYWIGHKIGEIEEESKLIIVTPGNRQSIFHNIVKSKFGKVIATQDQLSPYLINQLVAEYNNGGMQDFEIEITNEPQTDSDVKELLAGKLYLNKPKLTNGFVTVVEKHLFGIPNNHNINGVDYENTPVPDYPIGKPLEDYVYAKHSQDRCMGFIDGYNARKSEESIKYNEEQVIEYSYWLRTTYFNVDGHSPEDCLNEWFNENKKK